MYIVLYTVYFLSLPINNFKKNYALNYEKMLLNGSVQQCVKSEIDDLRKEDLNGFIL